MQVTTFCDTHLPATLPPSPPGGPHAMERAPASRACATLPALPLMAVPSRATLLVYARCVNYIPFCRTGRAPVFAASTHLRATVLTPTRYWQPCLTYVHITAGAHYATRTLNSCACYRDTWICRVVARHRCYITVLFYYAVMFGDSHIIRSLRLCELVRFPFLDACRFTPVTLCDALLRWLMLSPRAPGTLTAYLGTVTFTWPVGLPP